MKNKRLFLDIHAIQNLPPSNINRDDTGSPKTCLYGGVTRARVSSQAWKNAMRKFFNDNSSDENVGMRSKNFVSYIAGLIRKIDSNIDEKEALDLAENVIKNIGIPFDKYKKLKALFFMSYTQALKLAKAAVEKIDDKKILKEIINENPAIDIALFGRMLAGDSSLNEDASSQVAHAISTHAVQTEFDFFTAVDDLSPEDNAGAGMLGTIEFNSSTLYRYANIALHDFLRQIKDKKLAIDSTKLFVKAFSNSMPTGKINTFANQTLPELVLVTLREDRPVNLVSAYEKAIKSSDGYEEKSVKNLFKEYNKSLKFVNKPLYTSYVIKNNIEVESIGDEKNTLDELLKSLADNLDNFLPELRSDEI